MTLKSDAKSKEKLTCSFKYDMRSFVNFPPTNQKSQNFISKGHLSKVYEVWANKYSGVIFHDTKQLVQNLKKLWPYGFENDMRNCVNFHETTQKSEKSYIDGLFLCKAYVSVKKLQKKNVSWHWRVMQNLTESRFVAWRKTYVIWFIFMRTVESLIICTLIETFRPKYINILMKKYMTLESDENFEETLTVGSKNDMRNLENFNASSDKSENFHFDRLFL